MAGEQWQQIGANLSAITSGDSGSGHFEYDPDQLREIIKGWNELSISYSNSRFSGFPLVDIEGPGTEYASMGHAAVANTSGLAYINSLVESADYCSSQAQKYQQVLDGMLGVDSDQAEQMHSASTSDDGGI